MVSEYWFYVLPVERFLLLISYIHEKKVHLTFCIPRFSCRHPTFTPGHHVDGASHDAVYDECVCRVPWMIQLGQK
jgi:hypothetical protein